jgi:hypothetical protein
MGVAWVCLESIDWVGLGWVGWNHGDASMEGEIEAGHGSGMEEGTPKYSTVFRFLQL